MTTTKQGALNGKLLFCRPYIFIKMWWKCVNVFDTCFLAHFIWKFPPPKINSEGSVLVTVMSSVLVYLGLFLLTALFCSLTHAGHAAKLYDTKTNTHAGAAIFKNNVRSHTVCQNHRVYYRDALKGTSQVVWIWGKKLRSPACSR